MTTTPDISAQIAIRDVLSRLKPLSSLSPRRLSELAEQCAIEWVTRGSDPFNTLDTRQQLLYLVDGELKLDFVDGSFSVLVGNTEMTQWPLGKQTPAIRTSRAITDVGLIRISEELLDLMMTWDQATQATLVTSKTAEQTDWWLVSGAFQVQTLVFGALANLPPANISALLQRCERVERRADEIILREGDEGDYYYLIESGRCAVTRRIGGVDILLAELKPGDAFGEEALTAVGRRNATVTMKRDGVLLRLNQHDFIELLRNPLLRRLNRAEAEARVAAGAVWVDVRFPSEYQCEHLPGALNVPLAEIRNAIDVLDRNGEYVVYCQSGRRSSAAAFLLAQHGYAAAWLEGGLQQGMTGRN